MLSLFFYAEKRLAHCTSDYNDNITMKWFHLRTTNFLWDLNGRDVHISALVLTTVFEWVQFS